MIGITIKGRKDFLKKHPMKRRPGRDSAYGFRLIRKINRIDFPAPIG
jgi:hypothetical protein